MLMGADLSGLLWARLSFALVVIALLARLPWLPATLGGQGQGQGQDDDTTRRAAKQQR